MAKIYRVLSQGGVLGGRNEQDVYQALLGVKLKPDQAAMLMQRAVVIKKGLNSAQALQLVEQFSNLGLKVKMEAYDEEARADTSAQDQVFALLEKCFEQSIDATALSRAYQKSALLAILSGIISPLVYGLLVAAVVGTLVWYVFVGHSEIFGSFSARYYHLRADTWIIFLAIPTVIGCILTLFLLYPLWPRGESPAPYILDRKKNRQLYQLVEKMTAAMGVPAPEYIELVTEVNAAAAPVKGMVSLMQGRLRLIVGLSMVSGFTVQQFIGVLAHEFGHFSQRKSMLVYGWINRVTRWLSECAHGQDFWQPRIRRWLIAYEDIPTIFYTLKLVEVAIQGVRVLFASLLVLHVKMTSGMSQQMEFDADLYEAKVVGSSSFKKNSITLRKLAYAASHVERMNFDALDNQDTLLKNIPAAVVQIAEHHGEKILQQIEQDLHQEQTEFWHSHPADIERIRHVARAAEDGILTCDAPARILFNDFDRLCENSTKGLYQLYGIHGARDFIVPNEKMIQLG